MTFTVFRAGLLSPVDEEVTLCQASCRMSSSGECGPVASGGVEQRPADLAPAALSLYQDWGYFYHWSCSLGPSLKGNDPITSHKREQNPISSHLNQSVNGMVSFLFFGCQIIMNFHLFGQKVKQSNQHVFKTMLMTQVDEISKQLETGKKAGKIPD